jgi:hypothetical protein
MSLTAMAQISQILGGIALFMAAIAAWCTLFLYHRKNIELQWADGFRQIYADFWENDNVAKARRWIDNDSEYAVLKKF